MWWFSFYLTKILARILTVLFEHCMVEFHLVDGCFHFSVVTSPELHLPVTIRDRCHNSHIAWCTEIDILQLYLLNECNCRHGAPEISNLLLFLNGNCHGVRSSCYFRRTSFADIIGRG